MCLRGDIYKVNFEKKEGSSIQGGVRPVVVISNNRNNKHSTTVTVVSLTSKIKKNWLPVHVTFVGHGLPKPSMVLAEQIQTIDKADLLEENYIGHIDDQKTLDKIVKAINVQISALD